MMKKMTQERTQSIIQINKKLNEISQTGNNSIIGDKTCKMKKKKNGGLVFLFMSMSPK